MVYDLVFVYINIIDGFVSGAEYELNSGYIRAFLKRKGVLSKQYINKNIININNIIDDLMAEKSLGLTFYINEYNYYISKVIINNLKRIKPSLLIYCTGPSSEYIVDNLCQDLDVNIVLLDNLGQSLFEIIKKAKPLEKIENIAIRTEEGFTRTDTKAYRIELLDSIGMPYSEGLIPPEEIENVGMYTSKGCFGKCVFCSYRKEQKYFQYHSINSVISELKFIKEYISGDDVFVRFYDDCFSISNKRTLELCESIIENNLRFKYWCCIRSDILSKELIDIMAQCNFKNIGIGLETASLRVMDSIGKKKDSDSSFNYINNLKENFLYAVSKGLEPYVSVNFGLPGEEYTDALKTMEFLKYDLNTKNISVCYTTCFPGSDIFENSSKLNILKEESPTRLPFRTYYQQYDMGKILNYVQSESYNTINQQQQIDIKMLNLYEFYTGIYKRQALYGFPKQIYTKSFCPEEFAYISNLIDINGDIIINTDKLNITSKYKYCADRKNLKIPLKNYESNLKELYSNNVMVSNQIFIRRNTDSEVQFQVNDLINNGRKKIKIRKIDSKNELYSLIRSSNEFYDTYMIDVNEIEKGAIENSCIYTGDCSICKLPRLSVINGDVMACLSNNVIGKVGDERKKLVSIISEHMDVLENEGECDACKHNTKCSKCLFLPEFITREEYCSVIGSFGNLGRYIKVLNILNLYFEDDVFEDEFQKVYFPRNNYGNDFNCLPKGDFSDTILLSLKNTYYVCCLDTFQMFSCSKAKAKDILDGFRIEIENIP